MKRSLLSAGLLYVAGILVGNFIFVPLAILLTVSLIVALAAILWTGARAYLLYPLILLTAWTGYTFHTATISPNDLRCILTLGTEIVTVQGILTEIPIICYSEVGDKTLWHTMARIDVTSLRPNRGQWKPVIG